MGPGAGTGVIPGIEFVHFPQLDEVDQSLAEKAISKSHQKIGRLAGRQDIKIKIQTRDYHRSSGRKEYEVHSRVDEPDFRIFSTAKSWNFLTALEDSLDCLNREVVKKVKR